MNNNDEKDEKSEFSLKNEEIMAIFLYSYGGNRSKTYDLPLALVASDILAYRLSGKTERPDLVLRLKDALASYWKWNKHPERWNGFSE